MKTRIIILLIGFGFIVTAFAATLTIDIPTNDVPRVSEAFGAQLGLGRNANVAEVQAATQQWIVNTTKDYERRKNQVTYTPPPMEMQPSPTPSATPSPTAGVRADTPKPTATPKKKK